jgi:hypothetical protein
VCPEQIAELLEYPSEPLKSPLFVDEHTIIRHKDVPKKLFFNIYIYIGDMLLKRSSKGLSIDGLFVENE